MPPHVAETMTTTRSDINLHKAFFNNQKVASITIVTASLNAKIYNKSVTLSLVVEQDTSTLGWIL